MKINWGTGIVIAFALFMSFILFFVFNVQSNSKYDNELVVEEYYKKEIVAQQDLDREQNAYDLSTKVIIKTTAEGISIDFPADFEYENIKGIVSLYRPSNQKLDFEIPISLSSSHLLIPKSNLVGGRWDITIDWNYKDKKYLSKELVYFHQ
ncbi:FixH family protein [Flavobacterium sp.]|uniref:FixH family protein n=1 Tax=Flavobacterium sp. TaxID=239 RepID=UPI002616E32F|nr:FixH family protein [Flavobacterium sp.]